jgi:putative membrane protein
MIGLLIRWLINAVGLYVTTLIVPGVHVAGFRGAVIAGLVLGIVNALLRPIVLLLTLPLTIVTLGLFALVVNTIMLYVVAKLTHNLVLDGFSSAFLGALVLSVISFILSRLVKDL